MRVIPRGKLDIGWRDLVAGVIGCWNSSSEVASSTMVQSWSAPRHGLACLSLRSGLDAMLSALALPHGTKILVSAVTLPDMIRVVEHHGLIPIALPVDPITLAIRHEDMERLADKSTKILLVAHLFGTRMPMDEIIASADRLGLLVFEDCAQAYTGDDWRGHPGSAVAGFSFGPIKTATALGGGALLFRDAELQQNVAAVMELWPQQTNQAFCRKLMKYASIKLLATEIGSYLLDIACRAMGKDRDEWLRTMLRGFRGNLIPSLRWRPSTGLLRLMARRLQQDHAERITERCEYATRLVGLMPGLAQPGSGAIWNSHWVLPLISRDPDGLAATLRKAGYDSTCYSSNIRDISASDGGWAARIVYLPMWPTMAYEKIVELARLTVSFESSTS